jgi:hypothetical protein
MSVSASSVARFAGSINYFLSILGFAALTPGFMLPPLRGSLTGEAVKTFRYGCL